MEGGDRIGILVVRISPLLTPCVCIQTIFSSLKNHVVDEEVEGMFEMGRDTMALPLEEKLKFEQGDQGVSFGCVIFHRFTPERSCRTRSWQVQSRGGAVYG